MHQSAACGPDPTWVQYTRIGPRKKPRRPNTSQTCEPEKQTSRVPAAARSRRTGLLPVRPRPQPDQAGRRRLLAYARTRLGWEAGLDALSDARRRVGCVLDAPFACESEGASRTHPTRLNHLAAGGGAAANLHKQQFDRNPLPQLPPPTEPAESLFPATWRSPIAR